MPPAPVASGLPSPLCSDKPDLAYGLVPLAGGTFTTFEGERKEVLPFEEDCEALIVAVCGATDCTPGKAIRQITMLKSRMVRDVRRFTADSFLNLSGCHQIEF